MQPHPSNLRQATQPASLTAAQNAIPLVRATAPGSEVVETQAYLTAVKRSLNTDHRDTTTANDAPSQNPAGTANLIDHTKHAERDDTHRVRRFFLRRDDQDPLQPSRDAGIRKKPADRNGSAVFMEDSSRSSRPGSRSSSSMRPIDRILNHTAQSPNVGQGQTPSTEATSSLDNHNQSPFQKPKSGITRTGKSIRDHPSTWNHDSDQLADELAALAIGMDTDSGVGLGADIHAQNIAQSQHGLEDEYVYETYLRIPHSNLAVSRDSQAGVLIVEDQDQELWHELIGNDEDEMWDAEDNDSNGKCFTLLGAGANVRSRGQSCERLP